jgi:hypothetical protein
LQTSGLHLEEMENVLAGHTGFPHPKEVEEGEKSEAAAYHIGTDDKAAHVDEKE